MSSALEIISGGQTGVDRAALDAALALAWPCGGWCPEGRMAEDGTIAERYPVKELKGAGYRQRTIQNLKDADGTLILYFSTLEGGTQETLYQCLLLNRPYKLIDAAEISASRAAELTLEFIHTRQLQSLNVAGPRASKSPGAYDYAYAVVTGLLQALPVSAVV